MIRDVVQFNGDTRSFVLQWFFQCKCTKKCTRRHSKDETGLQLESDTTGNYSREETLDSGPFIPSYARLSTVHASI